MFIPTMKLEDRRQYVVVIEHVGIDRTICHCFPTIAEAREMFPGVIRRVTTSTRVRKIEGGL